MLEALHSSDIKGLYGATCSTVEDPDIVPRLQSEEAVKELKAMTSR